MTLPQTTDILIVGAGPTGLACALSLVEQGHTDITIVDCILRGENSSRALVVHAATLEALDRVGCADRLVKGGNPGSSVHFWSAGYNVKVSSFNLLSPYTKFPMNLIVPQSVTEQVLVEKLQELGVDVLRPYKVVDLKRNEQDPRITDVRFESGEVVQTRCVVGADGARSLVRSTAGVNYVEPHGKDNEAASQMIIADVVFNRLPTLPDNGVLLILSADNLFMLATLVRPSAQAGWEEQEHKCRIAVGIPPSLGEPPSNPSAEYIQSLVDAWGPGQMESTSSGQTTAIKVTEVIWSSRFRTHSALADTFLTHLPGDTGSLGGPILLLGDAAHIHPPAGGQGMNLGIRDALALGPAISAFLANDRALSASAPSDTAVFSGLDVEQPLRAWATARRERALAVISMAKFVLAAMELKDRWTWVWGVIPVNLYRLRNVVFAFLTQFRWVRRLTAWRISGLGFKD